MPEIGRQTVLGSHAYRPRVEGYGILRSIPTRESMRALVPLADDRRLKPLTKRSPLPSWYPRKPLRDITFIVKAIEMRRAELRATGHQINNRDNVSPGAGSSPVSVLEREPTTPETPSSSSSQSAVSVATTSASKLPPSETSIFDSTTHAVGPADFDNQKVIKEHTTSSAKATSELNKKILEELERAVKEHLKSMPKMTVEKPRRSTLLMLR